MSEFGALYPRTPPQLAPRPPDPRPEPRPEPEPLAEHEPGPADLFDDMATRIRRNPLEEFAGAVVIVPPLSEDSPTLAVEILLIDPHHDEGHFWGVVKAKVDIETKKWSDERGTPRPGSYR